MWLMTQYGLYSVVAHHQLPGSMLVRAQARHDLENLRQLALLPEEIVNTPDAQYPYRLTLSGEEWGRCLFALGQALDYPSFSDRVAQLPDQQHKLRAYAQIAQVFGGMEAPTPTEVEAGDAGLRPPCPFNLDADAGEVAGETEALAGLEALFAQGRALGEAGDHSGALAVFEQLAVLAPGAPVVHWMQGVALSGLGRFNESIQAFQSGLALAPGDVNALWNLALACIHGKRFLDARTALAEAMEVQPDFMVEALPLLGYAYALEMGIEPLVPLDQWLLTREPGTLNLESANTFFLLVLATLALGQPDQALNHFQTLQEMDANAAQRLQPLVEAVAANLSAAKEAGNPTDWQAENVPLQDALERYARLAETTGEMPGEAQEIIYRTILTSWFLVPLDAPPQQDDGGAQLSFHLQPLEGLGPEPVLLTFTSVNNARLFWGEEPLDRAVIPGDSLCNLVATLAGALGSAESENPHLVVAAAVVIDPAGPHPFVLPLAAVLSLAQGEVPLN